MYEALFLRNGLSMERLYTLVLLQKFGSLIKAAQGDAVRQSQMSRHLTDLASYFELRLVEKAGKSLKLTTAGKELASLAIKHFDEITSFQERATNLPKIVVIAAEPNLLPSLIAPQIGRLGRSVKGLRFELKGLSAPEIIEELQEQSVSLGVFAEVPVPRNLQSTPLLEQHYGIIIPNRLVPVGGMITLQKALQECPYALDKSDKRLFSKLTQLTGPVEGKFLPALLCCSQEECVAALRSGHFASILPLSVLPHMKGTNFTLMEPPEIETLSGRIMIASSKRHLVINPHLAEIAELLKEFLVE